VARIRHGDPSAFEAMYLAYYQPLCAFVARCIGERDRSEELVQDLFCRIWEGREAWRPAEATLRGYLFRAARNRALNDLKHRRREREFAESSPPAEPAPTPEAGAEARDFAAALAAALAGLPPRCREACVLRWQYGLSHAEIATTMDVAVKAVEALITRGLKAMRIALSAFG